MDLHYSKNLRMDCLKMMGIVTNLDCMRASYSDYLMNSVNMTGNYSVNLKMTGFDSDCLTSLVIETENLSY